MPPLNADSNEENYTSFQSLNRLKVLQPISGAGKPEDVVKATRFRFLRPTKPGLNRTLIIC